MIMSGGILGPEKLCSSIEMVHPPQAQPFELDGQKGVSK
jgi:hypothetical protein